jgi:hypothetical protein
MASTNFNKIMFKLSLELLLCFAWLHYNNCIKPLLMQSVEVYKILDSQHVYSWYGYINDIVQQEMHKRSSCKTMKNIKSLKPD